MLGLFALLACRDKDLPPPDESRGESGVHSVDTGPASRWTGLGEDEGFGASLAADADGGVWVGAPFGDLGRVYRIEGDEVALRMEEAEFGALGMDIAWTADGLLAGAPLRAGGAGELRGEGGLARAGESGSILGGRIASFGAEIAATTALGVQIGEVQIALGERPGDLSYGADGTLFIGLPRGEGGVATATERVSLGAAREEVGSALCAADLDGDGAEELAVGAPGAGRVYLVPLAAGAPQPQSARSLGPGSGRFGAALACAPGELWVGAPTWGDLGGGAVWALDPAAMASGAADDPLESGEPGSDFGASILWIEGAVWVGAPGASEVRRLR